MTGPFRFRDDHGLRASIIRGRMRVVEHRATLHVETSFDSHTQAAAWGYFATLKDESGNVLTDERSGEIPPGFNGATTLAELSAFNEAFTTLTGRHRGMISRLTLSTRSTAAMAVLRWVFIDAAFTGYIQVERPQALRVAVRDFQPLYDLYDAVERAGLVQHLSLELTPKTDVTEHAFGLAREGMERARAAARGVIR